MCSEQLEAVAMQTLCVSVRITHYLNHISIVFWIIPIIWRLGFSPVASFSSVYELKSFWSFGVDHDKAAEEWTVKADSHCRDAHAHSKYSSLFLDGDVNTKDQDQDKGRSNDRRVLSKQYLTEARAFLALI
jgi:hypothetical protein